MTNQTTGTRAIPAIPPTAPIPTDVEGDPTHLAAAEWFVRLHGAEASVEDTLAWQRWLHESASHAEAFARIEEVSQVLRSVPPPAAVTASRLASDRYDASMPLKDWKEPEAARFRWLPLALAAACAGIVVSVVFWRTAPPNTFTTAVGEKIGRASCRERV